MTSVTGGQALVQALKAEGVEVIFGVPGTQNLPIFDALVDEPAIRLIANRHEQGSGYMADGYARASGRPGVVVTVSGPGALNAMPALGQAYSDSSPVLLVSSQVNAASLDRDAEDFHQLRDAARVFQSVTKWQGRARSVAAIPGLVRAAFQELCSGRPRPVYLEIPQDVLFASGNAEPLPARPVGPLEPAAGLVERAAEILGSAQRPVFYVGGGAIHAGAGETIMTLAERLQAPVVVSPNGKGAVAESHPLVVGSGWGAHQVGNAIIEQADVCLALGTRFGPYATSYWKLRFPRLIHVDADHAELGKQYQPEVGIVADARLAARSLVDALDRRGFAASEACWVDVAAHRLERRLAIEDHAGGDHRTGQATAANFVRPGDAAKTKIAEPALDRRHLGDARQLREERAQDFLGLSPVSFRRCVRLCRGDPGGSRASRDGHDHGVRPRYDQSKVNREETSAPRRSRRRLCAP